MWWTPKDVEYKFYNIVGSISECFLFIFDKWTSSSTTECIIILRWIVRKCCFNRSFLIDIVMTVESCFFEEDLCFEAFSLFALTLERWLTGKADLATPCWPQPAFFLALDLTKQEVATTSHRSNLKKKKHCQIL